MVLTFRAMRGTDAAYGATRCAVLEMTLDLQSSKPNRHNLPVKLRPGAAGSLAVSRDSDRSSDSATVLVPVQVAALITSSPRSPTWTWTTGGEDAASLDLRAHCIRSLGGP
eukprot:2785920-Rhodomonas_salina.2